MYPAGQPEYDLDLELHAPVVPEKSKYEVLSTKVEVKLAKAEPKQWAALDRTGQQPAAGVAAPAAAATEARPPPPYAG
jgi:suppressor of G2 allele of SKP1